MFHRLAAMTPFGWWSVRKPAPGVTVLKRQDDFRATVLTETPHIHIHYFTSDAQLSKQGWAIVHLVCHGCQRARAIVYPEFDDGDVEGDEGLPVLRRQRQLFVTEHRACHGLPGTLGTFLCPPDYVVDDKVDFGGRLGAS
jgi:hypothetical protein